MRPNGRRLWLWNWLFSWALINKISIVVFEANFPANTLERTPSLKDLKIVKYLGFSTQLSLPGCMQQLASQLKLSAQFLEFFYDLGVSASGLAHLAVLAAAEAHIRISLILFSVSLKLWGGHERVIVALKPSPLPMLVDVFCEMTSGIRDCVIKRCFHFGVGQDRSIIQGGIGLFDGGGFLKEVHYLLELFFGTFCRALTSRGLFGRGIEVGKEDNIFGAHTIGNANGVLYGGRRSDISLGVFVGWGVETFILEIA